MNNKRWITSIVYLALGVVLLGCGMAQIVDEFWSGMGGALIGVGVMRLVQMVRYQNNEEYRENMDTERNDERNKFLQMKSWQMAAGWFTMIAAIGTFAFKFAGKEELMMLCSGGICLMVILYWACYLYLKRKY